MGHRSQCRSRTTSAKGWWRRGSGRADGAFKPPPPPALRRSRKPLRSASNGRLPWRIVIAARPKLGTGETGHLPGGLIAAFGSAAQPSACRPGRSWIRRKAIARCAWSAGGTGRWKLARASVPLAADGRWAVRPDRCWNASSARRNGADPIWPPNQPAPMGLGFHHQQSPPTTPEPDGHAPRRSGPRPLMIARPRLGHRLPLEPTERLELAEAIPRLGLFALDNCRWDKSAYPSQRPASRRRMAGRIQTV